MKLLMPVLLDESMQLATSVIWEDKLFHYGLQMVSSERLTKTSAATCCSDSSSCPNGTKCLVCNIPEGNEPNGL